jgi:hypothetical protein
MKRTILALESRRQKSVTRFLNDLGRHVRCSHSVQSMPLKLHEGQLERLTEKSELGHHAE